MNTVGDGVLLQLPDALRNIHKNGGTEYSVMTIVEDIDRNIWLGSRGGQLLCFNGTFFVDFSQNLTKDLK